MVNLKERLVDGNIYSYSRLPTGEIIADLMTKEMKIPVTFKDVILENIINIQQPLINELVAVSTEIRMKNIHNR